MASIIHQQNLYDINPATFTNILVISNDAIVSGNPVSYWNVKFVAAIFISDDYTTLISFATLIATTKTIPNNQGRGIYNSQRFFESYVRPQYNNWFEIGTTVISEFQGNPAGEFTYFPIHCIDKFSKNDACMRYTAINGQLEGSADPILPAQYISGTVTSGKHGMIFNGYFDRQLNLDKKDAEFGYDYFLHYAPTSGLVYGILSDAPRYQYASKYDYGVVSAWNQVMDKLPLGIFGYTVRMVSQSGVVSTLIETYNTPANGGPGDAQIVGTFPKTEDSCLFMGVFPANMVNANSNFAAWINNTTDPPAYYDWWLGTESQGKRFSYEHRIYINCPKSNKGYKPIRIGWLNSMGGWDYYTFKMKSQESVKTKANNWTQLEGSWNQKTWNPQGYKGGKKAFTVNAERSYVCNSDFISEEEAEWFEKMINSPEHYIIKQWKEYRGGGEVDQWYDDLVIPVKLMTSSFKKKTRANDNVIQYTFKFKESKMLNTQPV